MLGNAWECQPDDLSAPAWNRKGCPRVLKSATRGHWKSAEGLYIDITTVRVAATSLLPTRIKGTLSSKMVDQASCQKNHKEVSGSQRHQHHVVLRRLCTLPHQSPSVSGPNALLSGRTRTHVQLTTRVSAHYVKTFPFAKVVVRFCQCYHSRGAMAELKVGYLWGKWLENRLSFGGRFTWGVHTVPWDHSSYIAHQDHSFTIFKSSCDRLCRTSYH